MNSVKLQYDHFSHDDDPGCNDDDDPDYNDDDDHSNHQYRAGVEGLSRDVSRFTRD